jgi:hypothetical protein
MLANSPLYEGWDLSPPITLLTTMDEVYRLGLLYSNFPYYKEILQLINL